MNNTVWEKTLIGTVIADPKTMAEADVLIPSDFTGANQIIWSEILSLNSRNGLDARSLVASLQTSPDLPTIVSDVGNLELYLSEVLPMKGTQVKEYTKQVLDASIKKTLRRNAALIAAEAEDNNKTAEELLDYSEKKILSVRRNRMDEGLTMADLMALFIPRLEGFINGTIKPAWTPACQGIKDIIKFAEETDYITVAARPGAGKSSLLRYECYHLAKNGGQPLIFNLENDPMDYAKCFTSLISGIDSEKMKEPTRLTPDELTRIKVAGEELAKLDMRIITMAGPSALHIMQMARRSIAEKKANLVVVDYVQLVRNGIENKVQDVSETTGTLRNLALQMHVPVLCASQLNRAVARRGGAEELDPELADLRDSGSIEQDSTMVIFLKPLWENTSHPRANMFRENLDARNQLLPNLKALPIKAFVRKNRGGETGVSGPIKWIKSTGDYQTLQRGTSVE